jgi:7,8-dihydro-6-hydroxymethylpterin-pyrophosphokinase
VGSLIGNRLVLVGLLAMALGCRGACMSEKAKMEILKAAPDRPRYMSFLMRSYTGSRQHLLIAAREMLALSSVGGEPEEQRTSGFYIMNATETLRENLMGVFSVRNQVSIEQALATAHEIEAGLADSKSPGARETVRIDLLWVQNVEVKLPNLTLPSPEIDRNVAVAFQFEETLRAVATRIFPEESDRKAMRAAMERAPTVQHHEWEMKYELNNSLGFYRKPDHNEWSGYAPDRSELLAVAGTAIGAALIERLQARMAPEEPVDPEWAREIAEVEPTKWSDGAGLWNSRMIKHGYKAVEEQLKIKPRLLLPLEIAVDKKTTEEMLFMRWMSEVQSTSRENHVRIGEVIVTSAGANWVRGAIIGEAADAPIPGIQLLGVRLEPDASNHMAAQNLRVWTGKLFGQPPVDSP